MMLVAACYGSPCWAVTFVDQPLLPDMTFAPALSTRIKAPVLDSDLRIQLGLRAVPMFRTLGFPTHRQWTEKRVKAQILPRKVVGNSQY